MVKTFNYVNLDYEKVDYEGKKVIIWGRGVNALYTLMELDGLKANVIGFADSFSKEGEVFAGHKVYSVDDLEKIDDLVIYIAVGNSRIKREILYTLEEKKLKNSIVVCRGLIYGCWEYDTVSLRGMVRDSRAKVDYIVRNLGDDKSKETFENLVRYRETNDRRLVESVYEDGHKQYFPLDGLIKPCKDEIFLDIGAFDGQSSIDFMEWTAGDYKKIYLVEADDNMFDVCREKIKLAKLKNTEFIKRAIWSTKTILKFNNSDYLSGSGTIDDAGEKEVESISIDELSNDRITFIKMDVEGAEMEALIGGEKTITKYHPKLAISIYHKDDDLWEIPYYLMKKYPFYKYYIRHYTPYTTETILYATE